MAKLKAIVYKINKFAYPEEIFVIGFFILFAGYFFINKWQIFFWDTSLSIYGINRLLLPMVVFFVLSLFKHTYVAITKKQKLKNKINTVALDTVRVWSIFYLALITHLNLKIRIPLINSALYDSFFYNFDLWISWLTSPILVIRDWFQGFGDITILYAAGYEMLFLVTFVLLYIKNKKIFRVMFFATILSLLFGAVSYSLFPAIGPFYYDLAPSDYLQQVQASMMSNYNAYVESGGQNYPAAYLVQGIAAMPSLHVANTLIFVYFIWIGWRKLSIIYIPMFIYILIDAMYTKYHYSLDVFFGILLALISIYISQKIYQKRQFILLKKTV